MLDTHDQVLKEIGLYRAIRNVQYGILQGSYHLLDLLEMYNSTTDAFFALVSEQVLTLHEMYEVSMLSMDEASYKEYIPTTDELNMLKAKDMRIYETYWEMMMCHFVCVNILGTRSQIIGHKVWATYLF